MASQIAPEKVELAALNNDDLNSLTEALNFNVGVSGAGFTEQDLQRITIPTGGGLSWAVQTLEGETALTSLQGVIVHVKDHRSYWSTAYGSEATTPPDCASDDGITGFGSPGGECASCPLNQFGSHADGRSKACSETKALFFLRGDSLLPEVVSIPPTSLKAARQYLMRLTAGGVPYFRVITSLVLERQKNAGGIPYSEVRFAMIGKLDERQSNVARMYHEFATRMSPGGAARRLAAPTLAQNINQDVAAVNAKAQPPADAK